MVKKLISVIAIALCIVMVFGACGTKGTNGTNSTEKEKFWAKVEKVDVPNYQSGNMTLADFEKQYRPYTDWRIYEIRTTVSDVKPAEGGTAYYVSNNGKVENDGLTPETPVPTYISVMGKLKKGDVVYFERGSEFRGNITVSKEGVTLAAYGEGKAPVFRLYKENAAGKGKWEETDTPNVYKFYEKVSGDVGVVVFDDTYYTYKSFYTKDDMSNSKSKKYVNSYKDLKEDLQLYHDPMRFDVYVYCEKGNPGEVYDSVEFVPKGNVIKVNANNVTIDGLCIKNSGFGIHGSPCDSSNSLKGLTVRNCEIGWIGGYGTAENRLGNGIEIWGGAIDFIVENNYFYQIYDAGVTFQFSSEDKEADVENVQFKNNVFDYCNYSIEYFMTIPGDKKMKDFVIDGNLCWNAGEGMCSQRPDRNGPNHIKSWKHNNHLANQIKVTNNLFALGFRQLCETCDDTGLGAAYDNNIYVQTEGKRVAMNGVMEDYFKMDANVKKSIETYLGDKNATIITIAK
ncbi:MAG: hypothetical protein IJF35_03365 [Clostridia bacterium]|nr:hypothetical protein [Clostridia bacterium]